MQVKFEYVSYKNFLSTGSAGTRIELNEYGKTLVVGVNGGGKSTVIDSICFGLFGKAFRNINKPQLVNSINKKNCLVEIGFSIGVSKYRVVRGIKPNIFEIYQDDKLINQEADTKDYQKVLETQIIKMNHKTFTQVVVLGSSSYIPFMKLSAGARREVIDEILDIKILTVMSKVLKERITESKSQLSSLENKLDIIKSKAETQQRLIKTLSESKDSVIESLMSKISECETEIKLNQDTVDSLLTEIEALKEKTSEREELSEMLNKARLLLSKKTSKVSELENSIDFFDRSDECPTCTQAIDHTHKRNIVGGLKTQIKTTKISVDMLQAAHDKMNEKLKGILEVVESISNKNLQVAGLNSSIGASMKSVQRYRSEVDSMKENSADIEAEKKILKDIAKDGIDLGKDKAEVSMTRDTQDACTQLLKDSGVKTAIIKEYLPAINRLINKHLSAMEFFVKFELDENFDEVIKSRHRDEFSYASFSEGEKFRIDMAIMFTWREIARMKNSINTNILFFDEVLDGVLDKDGIDFFLGFIDSLGPDTNSFIISHKVEQISDRFDRVLSFQKVKDFSQMTLV